jgi:hypothetical protein
MKEIKLLVDVYWLLLTNDGRCSLSVDGTRLMLHVKSLISRGYQQATNKTHCAQESVKVMRK